MMDIRRPNRARGQAGFLTALGAVLAPLLVLALLATDERTLHGAAIASSVVSYIVVLFATVLLYMYWRTSAGPIGWLVIGLALVTVQTLAMYAMVAINPEATESHPGWIVLTQVLVALGIGVLVLIRPQRTVRVDPLMAGVLIGLLVVAFRYTMITTTPAYVLSDVGVDVLRAVVLAIDVAITFELFKLTDAPGWVRIRLGAAWGLLSIAHAATYPVSSNDLLEVVTIVANILGATLLLTLALALLQGSLAESRSQLRTANMKLEKVEADLRGDAARLHEIRATLSGVTNASHLTHQADITDDRRREIESMIDSELSRLQRLLGDDPSVAAQPIELDAIIEPLVLRHQLLGFPVRWRPSGERVLAVGDNVAEVVNVLLENAYQHAAAGGAWIYTRRIDGIVEIAVADSGPGVDRSVRSRIFEWGERSKESSGSGIGLNVAQQLTAKLGGYLRLVDSPALGATFVIGLPTEEVR